MIAVARLHDALEKTDGSTYDIRARFGRRVGKLVCTVSHGPRIPGYARRQAALRDQVSRTGEDALTVFAADRLSKLRELRHGDPARGSKCVAGS